MINITKFKKRFNIKIKKIKFSIFIYKIILFRQILFKYYYFFFFKKYLKNNFKLKYSNCYKLKVWIFYNSNYIISKKSKNSRMGKGKGNFLRWETRLPKFFSILKLLNLNKIRISNLIVFWKKYLNIKLIIYK